MTGSLKSGTSMDDRDEHSMKRSGSTEERDHEDREKSASGNSGKPAYSKGEPAPYPGGRGPFRAPMPYNGFPHGHAPYGHPMPPNYSHPGLPPSMGHFAPMPGRGPHPGPSFHPGNMPPSSYHHGQGMYAPPPAFGGPPPPHYQYQHSMNNMPHNYSSNDSVSSLPSKNSKKKRTIDGVMDETQLPSSAYMFRRTDSTTSSTTTNTVGNNTSTDTYLTDDSRHKRERSDLPPLNMGSLSFDDDVRINGHVGREYHERNYSGDSSTASSLSAGGYSLNSYDARRGIKKASSKRHKASKIDTSDRGQTPSEFDKLAIDAKLRTTSSLSTASVASKDQNIFMSLSTSPINNKNDVDQTPISKNTKKGEKHRSKKLPSSETPTPPAHGPSDDMMIDDQGILNRHLRGQSFTPLPHLDTSNDEESSTNSPSDAARSAVIAPQLSWSIAGDSPSLGDLADWEDGENKTSRSRPNSATSADSRRLLLSPNEFSTWKDDTDDRIGGTTTPLPAFFGKDRTDNIKPEHLPSISSRGASKPSLKSPSTSGWPKLGESSMPPTPIFSGNYHYGRSPQYPEDYRREPIDTFSYGYDVGSAQTDRIRNLRGRVMHPGMPPMPLHIHPGMPTHLPMTSPMGMGTKANMWSPPGGIGHGIPSPHHTMGSSSKRNCVPLKPPIPARFQGDMEKMATAHVPDFTSLVNFPSNITTKQAANMPEGMRCCVMCGNACPCSTSLKGKKGAKAGKNETGGTAKRGNNNPNEKGTFAIIPSQNKGLCTLCDVDVWVIGNTGLEIKWCKGCKNFRPWAAFGDKGLATKCLRCRDRQREKYALQKEEKEKALMIDKQKKESVSIR